MNRTKIINQVIEHVMSRQLPMKQINEKRFELTNENLKGEVRIYDFAQQDILELSILDLDKNETIFYLHFELMPDNDVDALYFVEAFFKTLEKQADSDVLVAYSPRKTKKILLCCTGGLSSYLFASMMQEYLESIHSGMSVDAVGIAKVDAVAQQYDLILMAPSISYRYEEYKKKYGERLHRIDPRHFATLDIQSVLLKIQ